MPRLREMKVGVVHRYQNVLTDPDGCYCQCGSTFEDLNKLLEHIELHAENDTRRLRRKLKELDDARRSIALSQAQNPQPLPRSTES